MNTTCKTAACPPSPTGRALPIAGHDADDKMLAAGRVYEFGFDAVDAGPLSERWSFERAKPAYCVSLGAAELRPALAVASLDIEVPHGSWRKGLRA